MPRYYKEKIYTQSQRLAYAKKIAKFSDFEEAAKFLQSGLTPEQFSRQKFEAKRASIRNFKNKSKR